MPQFSVEPCLFVGNMYKIIVAIKGGGRNYDIEVSDSIHPARLLLGSGGIGAERFWILHISRFAIGGQSGIGAVWMKTADRRRLDRFWYTALRCTWSYFPTPAGTVEVGPELYYQVTLEKPDRHFLNQYGEPKYRFSSLSPGVSIRLLFGPGNRSNTPKSDSPE